MSENKPREFYFEFMSETKEYQQLSDKPPYVRDSSFELVHVIDYKSYQRAIDARDAYAKAMAIALRNGIFAEKERVKREIDAVLQELGEDRGDG